MNVWTGSRSLSHLLGAGLLTLLVTLFAGPAFAVSNVPEQYYPNYEIADEYQELLDLLIVIESQARVEGEPESINYEQLHELFDEVFEFFPQTASNRILYESCRAVTETLGDEFARNDYYVFKDRCFSPLNDLIQEINSKYTVQPDIEANPKNGPAPLNVTLDARGSNDPSNDTIPSDNFFWYYKDVDGDEQPIGQGPVINHTFSDPGRHVVHLTVRSSNNLTEGVFDGEANVPINVAPKAANITVYVNGKKATTDDILRLGTQEAEDGIYIDGTATAPIGQRTILSHEREIDGEQGQDFEVTRSGDGPPGQFLQRFPENGVYSLDLTIEDNEGNTMSESYEISVSDPVASIKYDPEQGTTSSTYSFDGSASYSLTSRIDSYQRVITNEDGEQIDTVEAKEVTKRFPYPGVYTVKLTVTDELGNQSFDTQQITVGSTPPVPSFTITSFSNLQYPSRFVLNASPTYDFDVSNGSDELSYRRTFSNSKQVDIESEENGGRRIVATFKEPGEHIIRLMVEDAYGEMVEIEKTVSVESTLRPELTIDPVVSKRGAPVAFSVTTNKEVAYYEWNFGDGAIESEQDSSIEHTYQQAGIYPVSLRVVTAGGESNEITRQVFVGQQEEPTVAYEVKKTNDTLLTPTSTCTNDAGEEVPAYKIDRYQNFLLDGGKSTNVQGTRQGLAIQFHPENDEVYTKKQLSYEFPLLGCQSIKVFVDDMSKGKTAERTIWFDVQNALPTLDNLELTFPQASNANPTGIGLNVEENQSREIFSDETIDEIVVRVSARGAEDPDGVVSHFVWYYYPSADPNRILNLKVTPGDIPRTTFVVPKPYNPTEYAFGVRLVDNDDGEITSRELLGEGPLVFFPPTENSLDVPIVNLKTDKVNVNVGEQITFTAQASILSNKPDFDETRYFKYDFEGDGEFDLTTKEATITHTYQKPGEKFPKVSVYYRGRAGIGNAEKILVKKGINPIYIYDTFDNKILLKQMSAGSVIEQTVCMDVRKCRDDESWIKKGTDAFLFTYDQYGDHFVQQTVVDSYANEKTKRELIATSEAATGELGILSLPAGRDVTTGTHEIAVGESLNNTVTFYIAYQAGNCFVDIDITEDADKDGDPTADRDIACNEMIQHAFTPASEEQRGRIYYVKDGKIAEKDLLISFIDYEQVVNEDYQWAAKKIDELLADIDAESQNDILNFYKDLLTNLKSSLGEKAEMNSVLIQLRDLLSTYPQIVSSEHKAEANTLFTSLSDSTVQSAFGGTEYEEAKANVLSWFPPASKEQATRLFAEFENLQGNKTAMKEQLDKIFTLAGDERAAGRIDDVDFADIQRNLCDIITYYELPSKTCGTLPDELPDQQEPEEEDEGGTFFGSVIRIILRVVGVLAVIFVAIIVFFAIKARRQAEQNEQEVDILDETSSSTDTDSETTDE